MMPREPDHVQKGGMRSRSHTHSPPLAVVSLEKPWRGSFTLVLLKKGGPPAQFTHSRVLHPCNVAEVCPTIPTAFALIHSRGQVTAEFFLTTSVISVIVMDKSFPSSPDFLYSRHVNRIKEISSISFICPQLSSTPSSSNTVEGSCFLCPE